MNDEAYIPMSYSSLSTFLTCPKKYYLSRKYRPIDYNEALSYGSLFHEVAQEYSKNQDKNDIQGWIDNRVSRELVENMEVPNIADLSYKMSGMAKGMCLGNPYWNEIIPFIKGTEVEFSYTIPKFGIFGVEGIIDAIIEDRSGIYVVDYKTATDMRRYASNKYLKSNHQATIYFYACKHMDIPIRGVIFMAFKKTQLRQTKKESVELYEQRIINDYIKRPEFYFYRDTTYRDKDSTKFEDRLIGHFNRLEECCAKEDFWMNESACYRFGPCTYIPICYEDPMWESYFEEINSESD